MNANGHRKSKAEVIGDADNKPPRAVPDYTALPQLLKDSRRWLLWNWHWDGKKWDKPPSDAKRNGPSWGDSALWATLNEASEALHRFKSSGLGVVMQKDETGLVAIDLDDCVNPATKEICDWTPEQAAQWPKPMQPREIMAALGGYWEFSVSGTGLRCFVLCPGVDEALLGNKSGAEFYLERKYLTVTGYRVDPNTGRAASGVCEIGAVEANVLNGIMAGFGESKKEQAAKRERERKAKAKPKAATGDTIEPTAEMVLDKMMGAANGEKIAELMAGNLAEHGGDHSKADSALACHIAFYAGNRPELIDEVFRGSKLFRPKWDEVHGGDGRTYGQMTIDNALSVVTEFYSWEPPPCVTNVGRKTTVDEDGEEQVVAFPLPIEDIIGKTREQTADWPRRVGNQLFVHEGETVNWLPHTDSLFGYLHAAVGRVTWAEGASLVRRPEFQSRLSHTATAYEAVENLPHFPPRANTYYAHRPIVPGDGSKLAALLSMFCPATEIDGDLIKAAFVTAFWGGPGGARPAFVFTSDDGRGVGKSTISKVIGKLCGGLFDFSNGEDVGTIKKRLLTTESSTTRVTLIDNIKSNKLSWAELESFVTAAVISGHRLYAGERTRPNTLLWTLTLNGPAMSRDMAQRSVLVKLKRPEHDGDWEKNVNELIDAHRWEIIADVAEFFASQAEPLERYSRWGYWEREVLARLPEPSEAQQVILDRQSVVDVDEDEAREFEEFVAGELERLGYDIDNEAVHIPGLIAREWMFKARGERLTTTAITRMVRQWANEGTATAIQVNPSRSHGRGLRWAKRPTFSSVATDLERRMREDRAIFGGEST